MPLLSFWHEPTHRKAALPKMGALPELQGFKQGVRMGAQKRQTAGSGQAHQVASQSATRWQVRGKTLLITSDRCRINGFALHGRRMLRRKEVLAKCEDFRSSHPNQHFDFVLGFARTLFQSCISNKTSPQKYWRQQKTSHCVIFSNHLRTSRGCCQH